MQSSWPQDVPWTLWTFQNLTAEDLLQVPMMGVRFSNNFLYAFAFGCIFIAFFAWRRFNQNPREVDSTSETLRSLEPRDLGSQYALARAYSIYAASMLVLYVSLTFFGKLILQATAIVDTVGIAPDIDDLNFDSPQWPLTLAFAFAGFTELLPPVRIAENWLRDRAYRAAGIPVRLEQIMRSLVVTLAEASHDRSGAPHNALTRSLTLHKDEWDRLLRLSPIARRNLDGRPARRKELVALLAQIEMLIHWARNARGSWPGTEVSQNVRAAEATNVETADNLLKEFQRRLNEPEQEAGENQAARDQRFDARLDDIVAKLRKLRRELVSVLAVFIERDPDIPTIDPRTGTPSRRIDPALAVLLNEHERPENVGSGPEAGLLVLLVLAFLIYAVAAWRGGLELIGQYVKTTNANGVLLTALVETLRLASLTWLPLLAAFSLRQFLADTSDWEGMRAQSRNRSRQISQMMACMFVAMLAAMIGLAGVAYLRAFTISANSSYFNSILYSGPAAFMLYYPSLAISVLMLVPLCLLAADRRVRFQPVLGLAVIAAIGVTALSIAHIHYWNPTLGIDCRLLQVVTTGDCARRADTLTHLMLGAMTFLSICLLGQPSLRPRRLAPHRLLAAPAAMVALVVPLVLALPGQGLAQPVQQEQPIDITIGFRHDAEPFSYTPPANASDLRPIGFLADLCRQIFDGSWKYRVREVRIDVDDRFERLGGHGENRIDMLCDAVTMRFSDPERSKNAIYSPIVFASGVSYLSRNARAAPNSSGDVVIGYASGTTSREVALKACQIDLFRALLPTDRTGLHERCQFIMAMTDLREMLRNEDGSAPRPNQEKLIRALGAVLSAAPLFKAAYVRPTNTQAETADPVSIQILNNLAAPLGPEITENCEAKQSCASLARKLLKRKGCLVSGASGDCDEWFGSLRDAMDDQLCRPVAAPVSEVAAPLRSMRDYHFCPRQRHDELIRWMCLQENQSRQVYMGDRELILGKLESWRTTRGPCLVDQPKGSEYLTYEPYAFLIDKNNPDLVQFVQRRIHEIFSHREAATGLFASHFAERQMSPALAYLFLLNAVERREAYLVSDQQDRLPDLPRPTTPLVPKGR